MGIRVSARYHQTPDMEQWNRNPLISALGPYHDDAKLAEMLKRNPYDNLSIERLPKHIKRIWIEKLRDEAFVPITDNIEIAQTVQTMLFMGLMRRDPTGPEVWAGLYESGRQKGRSIDELPWSSEWADGLSISAMTGRGKTHAIKRYLSLLPQVIDHDTFPGVPWKKQSQLVYLYFDMSFDGTLGGLLYQIVSAFDLALGTNHRSEYFQRGMTLMKLQVYVIDLLRQVFCGFLVIDELQKANTITGHSPELVAGFFLRLMNAGIPVIFTGAPYGFNLFHSVAQDAARTTSGGELILRPMSADDPAWDLVLVPGMWQMQVMPVIGELDAKIRKALYQCSGGLPRYLTMAQQNGQIMAISENSQCVTAEHIYAGFQHLVAAVMREMIEGLVERDPAKLIQFVDIDVFDLARHWGIPPLELLKRLNPNGAAHVEAQTNKTNDASEISKRDQLAKIAVDEFIEAERKKIERQLKTKQTNAAKRKEAKESMVEGDVRKSGYEGHLADSYMSLHK